MILDIPTYCNVDSFSHGIYLPIVTLTVSVMVYTHLLQRWQFQSCYILTYCNPDSFSYGIYLPIWYKEPDMNNQLSTEHLLMINDLSANKSGIYACRAYNIINGRRYTIIETINVTIGEYIPWLKLSTLQ
jgi:hypothetical protein